MILALIMAGCVHLNLWEKKDKREKTLTITIPEDLDYTSVFDELFDTYTEKWELAKVKTTNMGSLFKLAYQITLKDCNQEKEMIDGLRCRNGNLEIVISNQENVTENL